MTVDKAALQERFTRALLAHGNDQAEIHLLGYQVPILHGLVALAMDHPLLKETVSAKTLEVGHRFRQVCKQVFQAWGLSAEDAEALDHLREETK